MVTLEGFLLFLMLVATSTSEWVDVKERIVGRVIHIESLRFRGQWAYVTNEHDGKSWKYYIGWRGIPLNEVHYSCTNQFLVTEVTDEGQRYLMLESTCDPYRNRFLSAGYPDDSDRQTIMLMSVTYKEGASSAHWTVKCENGDLEKCQFLPRRWSDRRMTHTWQDGRKCSGNYWCTIGEMDWDNWQFRIYAPNPTDGIVDMMTWDNCGADVQQKYTKSITVGMSKTTTTSEQITSSTSMEVGGSFKAFSASASTSISKTWTKESSTTFEKSVKTQLAITVPANKKVVLSQLIGNYAQQFSIASEVYQTTTIPCSDAHSRSYPISRIHKKTTIIDLTQ